MMTENDLMTQRWYPVEDDVVGGYCVSNVDKPVSEQDPVSLGDTIVCWGFQNQELARHVALLHNKTLGE